MSAQLVFPPWMYERLGTEGRAEVERMVEWQAGLIDRGREPSPAKWIRRGGFWLVISE